MSPAKGNRSYVRQGILPRSLRQKQRTQRSRKLRRQLPLEMLESRCVLSALPLVDVDLAPVNATVSDIDHPADIGGDAEFPVAEHVNAPTAEMSNPTDGEIVLLDAINELGYIEITFIDVGGFGLDLNSINGNEISISGAGVGTAVLDGTATLVGGTTYRYTFTGAFVEGAVQVNLGVCTFRDQNDSPKWNAAKEWSFTVEAGDTTPPIAEISNPTDGATLTPAVLNSQGYLEVTFSDSGEGVDTATIDGDEIAISGSGVGTASLSGTATLVSGTTYRYAFTGVLVDGTLTVDLVSGSFQDLAIPPNLNGHAQWSMTLDTPDETAPTAQISNPTDGATVTPFSINTQEFLEVTFDDVGDGVDPASIDGNELILSGGGVGTAALVGTATLVSGTTYRYAFTGDFVDGTVLVGLVAGSFVDLADTPNSNAEDMWEFAVQSPPPFQTRIIDNGDAEFASSGAWIHTGGGGHLGDVHYNAAGDGSDVATWTLTGLPAGEQYQVSASWSPFVNRATNAPYRILDGTTEVFSTTVNQRNAPQGDVNDAGTNFQHLGVVTINSGTLVIELSDDANAYVIADAVRVSSYAPEVDTDAPTAQMSNPTDGATVTPDVLNSQRYLEVTFSDIGDGVDPASVDGSEITISGSGVGTATLVGTADLVSGTTYRYAFTGDFVDGVVSVELVAGSFQDLADAPNANSQAAWSFSVQSPSPFQTQVIDNGDAEFGSVGAWVRSVGGGHQNDVHYNASGNGSDVATWALTGVPVGNYQISASWSPFVNRATNAPYRILDGTTEVFSTLVNQTTSALGDVNVSGTNFQHLGVVTINSGTLVIELSDDANGYVIADAVRVAHYVDQAGPTAQMSNPNDGVTVTPASLNAQGYLEVVFADIGEGVDAASIDGSELTISGSGVGTAALVGSATPVSGTTYRYAFTGAFVDGDVSVELVAGSLQDLADTPNLNAGAVWSFALGTPDLAAPTAQLSSPADGTTVTPALLNSQGYVEVTFDDVGRGLDAASIDGNEIVISGGGVGTAVLSGTAMLVSGTTYRYGFTGAFVDGAVSVDLVSGSFQDLAAAPNLNAADTWGFTLDTPDHTAPTAQISNPTGGANVTRDALNAQGYLELTFEDVGDGVDTATIDGNEIAISGAGVGTATLAGTATLVSGTTYRYAFTGNFVDGVVSVDLIAGSFQDLASTPNPNAPDNWSFSIQNAPPFQTRIIDDGDPEFSTSGAWVNTAGGGHQGDVHYNAAGNGSDVATWTLTGVPAGQYQVSATWSPFVNRATNSPYRILDGTTEVFSTTVNQRNSPLSDVNDAGTNFQHLGVVTVSSGTLVIELSDDANAYVIADAVRISAFTDQDAPTAQLSNPSDGATVTPISLNAQGYLDVTFDDVGDGIDAASIDGNEIAISGAGVGTAALVGTATLVGGTTYRYAFTGDFVDGAISVDLIAGSFQDLAATPNVNAPDSWSLTVQSPPPFQTRIIDNGDAEFSTSGSWVNSTGGGHQSDVHYSAAGNGADVATWTLTGLPAGQYQLSATWSPFVNRATNAPYRVLDGTVEIFATTVNQMTAPLADVNASGSNFQHLGIVTINSGTLVIELSDGADGYVIADAVRIEQINPPLAAASAVPAGTHGAPIPNPEADLGDVEREPALDVPKSNLADDADRVWTVDGRGQDFLSTSDSLFAELVDGDSSDWLEASIPTLDLLASRR